MDDRLRISLWMVGGAGLGGVLGGVFGAVTGWLYWKSGRAAGTRFGLAVAESFARAADGEMSHAGRGAIAGAADGILFLGSLGTLSGLLLAVSRRGETPFLVPAVLTGLVLLGGALFFGVLAYGMVRNGVRAVIGVFAGGVLGSVGAIVWLGTDYFLLGVLPGLVAGLLLSFVPGRNH
jgi:hypothetical protein